MRRQKQGGPIGHRLVQKLARVVMDEWERRFLKLAKENGIELFMFSKYVDDINMILEELKLGMRWDGQKIVWTVEAEQEDKQNNHPGDQRTMKVMADMSNSIISFLNFIPEVGSSQTDLKLPMLDIKLWGEEVEDETTGINYTRARYMFYEKKVNAKKVMMEQSALGLKTKIIVLTQEIIRWMI